MSRTGAGSAVNHFLERLDTRLGQVEPTTLVVDHDLDAPVSAHRHMYMTGSSIRQAIRTHALTMLIISVYRLGGIYSIAILRYARDTWKPHKVIR
jgi:hypothetical protein